jgi:hypothetical protein
MNNKIKLAPKQFGKNTNPISRTAAGIVGTAGRMVNNVYKNINVIAKNEYNKINNRKLPKNPLL